MTLVVYKNNVLAADARATVSGSIFDPDDKCVNCGADAHLVDDTAMKITVVPNGKDIQFNGSKVLAVGQAGAQELSKRLVAALLEGKDIKQIYEGYQVIQGPMESKYTSALLICCEDVNYTVRMPPKGNLLIKKLSKGKMACIGTDLKAVEWINELLPDDTSASAIISLTMLKNKGIGGPINEVNLSATPLKITAVKKKDSQELLREIKTIFALGKLATRMPVRPSRKALAEQQNQQEE